MGLSCQSPIASSNNASRSLSWLDAIQKPEWKNVTFDKGVSVSWSLLGERILLARTKGYSTLVHVSHALEMMEEIITREIPGGPFVFIEDYSDLQGSSNDSRRYYIDFMKRQRRLAGLVFFGLSSSMSISIRLARRLHIAPFDVLIARDYSDAVGLALEILQRAGIRTGLRYEDGWELEVEGFRARFEMLDKNVLHVVAKGFMGDRAVEPFFRACEKAVESIGFFGNEYHLVICLSEFSGISYHGKKRFMQGLLKYHEKHPFVENIYYGMNRRLRTTINLYKSIAPFKVRTCQELERALGSLKENRGRTRPIVRKGVDRRLQRYVDELLAFIGSIDWEADGIEDTVSIDPSDPFRPVVDAIMLVKTDLDYLFKEQKKAREALEESEKKYRDIYNNISDFLYFHDLEGNFTDTNDAWKREYGFSDEDLAGLHLRDILPKRYHARIGKYLERIKKTGRDEGLMTVVSKDGREHVVEYRNSLVYGPHGPIGVRGSARDITKRIETEKALRESEEKYRTILQNTQEGYYETDLAGNLVFFNNSMCRILGYERDELLKMNFRDYMDGANAKKVYQVFNQVFRSGQPDKGFGWELVRKDGKTVYVESSVTPITDKNGKVTGFRGVLRDITERKRAEEEIKRYSEHLEEMVQQRTADLQASEEKYRTILASIEDGYYEVDLAGNLVFCNDALCKITGYSRDEMIGLNNRDYMEPRNAHKLYLSYHQVYETGVPVRSVEWEMISKDGTRKHMENSISLIRDAEGRPIGFRGIVRDVTERKRLENELVKKTELANAASKAKSDFLANMSHEIRTPLNGILGMIELLKETRLEDQQKKIVDSINSEASSLYGLINNILDFSKIEARKLELEEVLFDLSLMIDDIAAVMSIRASQKNLSFKITMDPAIPSWVIGDPGRLRQILNNLLSNALKFTQKGEIALSGEVVEEFGKKVKVRFSVRDTGIGIAEHKQKIIFESFTQADTSTTRRFGGTGLGISIAKQLAELMGGEIGVESREGKGSTFWFTVVFKREKVRPALSSQQVPNLKNLRVMVVDPNQSGLVRTSTCLRSWGCNPLGVSRGADALRMLEEARKKGEPFDLILTEVHMPQMNGFALAEEIRAMGPFAKIPIIALTSAGAVGEGDKCREIGIQGYLTRPINDDDLRRAIELVLALPMKGGKKDYKLITRYTVSEMKKRAFRILLVEDYPTNQEVAMRHLEAAGYQVELAENGREAVEMFKKGNFDLILMDIQMPVMDGWQATAAIREHEKNSVKKPMGHVPIIAMTAHALKDDRDKCLEVGMDDYITKPVRRKELLSVVAAWLNSGHNPTTSAMGPDIIRPEASHEGLSPTHRPRSTEAMDFQKALAEFEGDREFLMEVAEGFLRNADTQIETMRRAIADGDAETLRKEAHAMKGGAANLTAEKVARYALRLENLGKSGKLEESTPVLKMLCEELECLKKYIKENTIVP
ncbi:MAG: PAS domain S-box protein [Deltaproteobacteria bacterium]|nr:PAS domain S-box protein [Deltaproteobacteria bacterium]